MTSRVEGLGNVVRFLSNLERRAHGAARKAVGATTRQVQLGIRAEVNSIFRKSSRAGNAIRAVVYDNLKDAAGAPGALQASPRRGPAVRGIVFSKFGRGSRASYVDYLIPYITGRDILPKTGKFLAIPLQKGKRNRKPRPDMKLQPVKSGGQLFLVKHQKRKSIFMFVLVPRARIGRRLRLAASLAQGRRTLTAETISAYQALTAEMKR